MTCPPTSDCVALITVFVIATPVPLLSSVYDLKSNNCWVQLADNNLHLFLGVSRAQIMGTPNWVTIKGNPEALLVGLPDNCPLELGQGGVLTL